jgi:predicted nucleotidyltransferase
MLRDLRRTEKAGACDEQRKIKPSMSAGSWQWFLHDKSLSACAVAGGASEVYLFGSVARRARGQGWVGVDADIDIAVSGVDPVRYFAVLADVDAVASVPVDLILVEDCSPGLRASIQRDGLSV